MMSKNTLSRLLISLSLGFFGCNSNNNIKEVQQESTPVQNVDLANVLYTTATIESTLPAFEENKDTCMFFHEDEWRQLEFITKEHKNSIDKEFIKIQDVYDNYSVDAGTYLGFKKIAVRDLILQPLTVDFIKLKSYFNNQEIKMKGLGLENNSGQVQNGFYFSVNGINYYGILEKNIIKTFCIYDATHDEDLKLTTNMLSKFLKEEKLYLVDWKARKIFDENTIKTEFIDIIK